jgi:hypothetical protein
MMTNFVKHNDVKILKTIEVLQQLNVCINRNLPFGLVRFGDGTIKAINAYYDADFESLKTISESEGLPLKQFGNLVTLWVKSANICNYIDCPEVYFSGKFWRRTKSIKKKHMSQLTITRLKEWKTLYDKIGITNTSYCNPEINFLSCLMGKFGVLSLPDLIRYKSICIITSRSDVLEKVKRKDYNIDVIQISGKGNNQYEKSFDMVLNKIDKHAKHYNLWLVAAGELGRVYPGLIKYSGGRAFDIGSLIDFWCGEEIPSRLKPYLTTTPHNPLKLAFAQDGKEFSKFI